MDTPPQTPVKKAENPPSIKLDHYNAKAFKVWQENGIASAMDHMFTDQDDPYRRQLSYSEMRMRYG